MSKGPALSNLLEELEHDQQELMGELELMKIFSKDLRRKPIKKYMREFKCVTKVYQEKTDEELLAIMYNYYFDLEEQ